MSGRVTYRRATAPFPYESAYRVVREGIVVGVIARQARRPIEPRGPADRPAPAVRPAPDPTRLGLTTPRPPGTPPRPPLLLPSSQDRDGTTPARVGSAPTTATILP